MAELLPQERLIPFLLDRLTDDEPQNKSEGRDRRIVSMKQYRRAILRDLEWLLNARAHPVKDGLAAYPEVGKSVLNFGMPDISGSTESRLRPREVEQMVRAAITAYEPRVVRGTLTVQAVEAETARGSVIAIEIRAQLWAQPIPESLYVKTEVDLETGVCRLQDQLHGG